MNEFKGTPGEWEYEVDLDYDQGGNQIGLGPVVEANGEVILKGITRNGTVEGCNFKDVRLAAAAPKLLEALQRMIQCHYPDANGQIGAQEECWASIQNGQAAIAKALGESK